MYADKHTVVYPKKNKAQSFYGNMQFSGRVKNENFFFLKSDICKFICLQGQFPTPQKKLTLRENSKLNRGLDPIITCSGKATLRF